jgi:hypothetical protein
MSTMRHPRASVNGSGSTDLHEQVDKRSEGRSWSQGEPELGFVEDDFVDGGSDRLSDTMVVWGSANAIATRVREHLDADANQGAVQLLSATEGGDLPRAGRAQVAEVLLG